VDGIQEPHREDQDVGEGRLVDRLDRVQAVARSSQG
jgi:hypothetical protein